jgi:hypothetical protein
MNNMEAIFNSNKYGVDIHMCSVPVPLIDDHKDNSGIVFTEEQISKYGQSQTHPSIEYRENGFGGHQWWMAATPYPKATGVFENPCIYYADTNEDGTPPTVFTPINGISNGDYTITQNPVVKVESNNDTNSDPDLFIDDELGKMYLISRDNRFNMATLIQESKDGQSWTKRPYRDLGKVIVSNKLAQFAHCPDLASPSLFKYNGAYKYIGMAGSAGIYNKNDKTNKGRFCGLYIAESSELKSSNDCFSYVGKSGVFGRQIEMWHSDCFVDNQSGYIYIICCSHTYNDWSNSYRRGMWLGVSKDNGDSFQMYPRPLMRGIFYRPTAIIDNNRNLVIYGSFEANAPTDASLYPNGESDIPVDGRAIFMSYKNFDDILATLEKDVITLG